MIKKWQSTLLSELLSWKDKIKNFYQEFIDVKILIQFLKMILIPNRSSMFFNWFFIPRNKKKISKFRTPTTYPNIQTITIAAVDDEFKTIGRKKKARKHKLSITPGKEFFLKKPNMAFSPQL